MLTMSVTVMQSCKKDDPDPDTKAYLENTWSLGDGSYIIQDGIDKTSLYPNLKLTFSSNGTYATQGAGKLFYTAGTWSWESSSATLITLDGDLPVEVAEIDQTTLLLKFHLNPDDVNASGRTKGVVGDYEILFKK